MEDTQKKYYILYLLNLFIVAYSPFIVKKITKEYSIFQILTFRSIFGLFFLSLFLFFRKDKTKKIVREFKYHKDHFYRGLISFISVFLWFYTIKITSSIPDIVIIKHFAPILTILLSSFFISEKLNMNKILSVLLGFIGILLIVKPQNISNNLIFAYCLAFLSALASSFKKIFTKKVSMKQSPEITSIYFMIIFLIICLPITIINYQHVSYKYLHLFLIHGFLFSLYNITLISVYSKIQLSTLQPLSFLKVLINIGLSNILFGTNIPINKFAGMAFIIFGSLAIKKSNNSSSQE